MSAVEDDVGVWRNLFKPAGPDGVFDSFGRNAESFERHGRCDGVLNLVLAGKRAFNSGEFGTSRGYMQIAHFEIAGKLRRNVSVQNSLGFGTLARKDRRNSGLKDTGLFRGDGFDGAAEVGFYDRNR